MKTIVAIGGGEIARHETLAIDKEIIRLSGKKSPTVLFIPTASSDAQGYIDAFTDYTIQNNYASNFAQEREQSCLIEPVIPVNAFQARVTAFMMSV